MMGKTEYRVLKILSQQKSKGFSAKEIKQAIENNVIPYSTLRNLSEKRLIFKYNTKTGFKYTITKQGIHKFEIEGKNYAQKNDELARNKAYENYKKEKKKFSKLADEYLDVQLTAPTYIQFSLPMDRIRLAKEFEQKRDAKLEDLTEKIQTQKKIVLQAKKEYDEMR